MSKAPETATQIVHAVIGRHYRDSLETVGQRTPVTAATAVIEETPGHHLDANLRPALRRLPLQVPEGAVKRGVAFGDEGNRATAFEMFPDLRKRNVPRPAQTRWRPCSSERSEAGAPGPGTLPMIGSMIFHAIEAP